MSLCVGCVSGPGGGSYSETTFSGLPPRRLLGLIVVATVPLVVAGLLFKDFLEDEVRSPEIVGGLLMVSGVVLWLAEVVGQRTRSSAGSNSADDVGWRNGVLIGVAQAIAVLPGISRAGSTVSAGMALGMSREFAARFSFLLAVPAIAGAGLFLMVDAISEESLSRSD